LCSLIYDYVVTGCGFPSFNSGTEVSRVDGSSIGNNATYSCVTGFMNLVGDIQRTCQDDKTLSGTAPIYTKGGH